MLQMQQNSRLVVQNDIWPEILVDTQWLQDLINYKRLELHKLIWINLYTFRLRKYRPIGKTMIYDYSHFRINKVPRYD